MTSKAVQPPRASKANSMGLAPLWPSASSSTNACPVPDWATNWRPEPSTVVKRNLPSIMVSPRVFPAVIAATPDVFGGYLGAYPAYRMDKCNLGDKVTENSPQPTECLYWHAA